MDEHIRFMLKISYASCPGPSGTIHSKNVRRSQKLQKNTETLYFKGSRSFKVIDVT